MKSYPYSPVLGWSISRYDLFSSCRRQYYYQYYAKWDTEVPQRRIALLRSLVTAPLQIGTVTHGCIAALLRRLVKSPDEPIDRDRFGEFAQRTAEEQHAKARYAEIHYGQAQTVDLPEIVSRVREALASLLGSSRLEWLTTQARTSRQEWLIDPEGYGETRVEGLKAYCKVDFLIPLGQRPAEDVIHILDWKTGRRHEERHSIQMRGYAAWAAYEYAVSPDRLIPVIAYLLPSYEEVTMNTNEYDMQGFAALVREQTREMHALCSDVEQNVPLPKERFPLTQVQTLCPYCNYRELCGRA